MPSSEGEERWQHLHPAMLLFSVIPLLRRMLVPLLVGGAATAQDDRSFRWFVYAASLFSVGTLLSRFLTFRYSLGPDAIQIQQGLFVKRSQHIAVPRIGQVDTEQGVVARRLGVVKLTIRTEGGSATEAVLPALSLTAAERIRALVRSAKQARSAPAQSRVSSEAHAEDLTAPIALYEITGRDILLEGATTFGVGFLLTGILVLWRQVRRLAPEETSVFWTTLRDWIELRTSAGGIEGFLFLAATAVAVLLLAYALNLAMAALRFYGFRVARQGDQLLVSSGLLTRRDTAVTRRKAQALRVHMTALRRWLGLFRVSVVAPGSGASGGGEGGRSRSTVLIPIAREDTAGSVDRCVGMVWEDVRLGDVAWLPVDPYHGRQQWVRLSLVSTLVFVGLVGVSIWWIPLTNAGLLVALALGYLASLVGSARIARLSLRCTRYAYGERFIYLAGGLLGFDRWVVPRGRIEGLVMKQGFFQRRRGLASLFIDLNGLAASSTLVIPNVALERASALLDLFSDPTGLRRSAEPDGALAARAR